MSLDPLLLIDILILSSSCAKAQAVYQNGSVKLNDSFVCCLKKPSIVFFSEFMVSSLSVP